MNFGDLRSLLYYVPEYRNRVFVIALDGALLDSPSINGLLLDLAVLHSLSIRTVLVFGVRHQIRQIAKSRDIALSDDNGIGITDAKTLDIAIEAAAKVSHEILRMLSTVDLRGAVSNCVIAHPAGVLKGVDSQFTGRVERIDVVGMTSFIKEGTIPVIAPLGFDGRGQTLRLNSDAVAMEIATALKAAKILYVAEHGVTDRKGERIAELSIAEALERTKDCADVDPSLISKLRHAAKACEEGIPRVHIVDGHVDEVLLAEVFSLGGVGTMVHSNEYRHMRPMREADIPDVLSMIQQAVEDAALLKRNQEEILDRLDDYFVIEVDGNVVGCCALHWHNSQQSEVACLYVKKQYKNQGYGRRLVSYAEKIAADKGSRQVFALSTQAYRFFEEKMSYLPASPNILPPGRKEAFLNSGRNAIVLAKEIGDKPSVSQ